MNKQEYMSALQSALADFEEELVQEIVADYEEHFAEGAAKGKTEEEIIKELGTVEELVAELCELQGIPAKHNNVTVVIKNDTNNTEDNTQDDAGNTQKERNTNYGGNWRTNDGGRTWSNTESFSGNFDSLMRSIGRVVDSAMREAGRAIEDAMEQVEIHMEEAKRKRAYYEDSNTFYESSEKETGEEPNIEQTKEGTEGCRRIMLDARIADVTIRQSRETDILPKASCRYYSHKTAMMYPFFAYQEGDTFYVGVQKQEQTERKSGFFQINISPSIEIELTVPAGVTVIQGGSISGDISVQEIKADNIKLQTKSGDMELDKCLVKEVCLEALSGDISVYKSNVNVLNMTTKSGDCELSKVEATNIVSSTASGDNDINGVVAERATFNTASGDNSLQDVQVKWLETSSASGDVEVRDCQGDCLNANSASGDVTVEANFAEYHVKSQSGDVKLMSRHDANIYATSTSGDVDVCVTESNAGYHIRTNTISGDCDVVEREELAGAEKRFTLEAKTISGDISVRFS